METARPVNPTHVLIVWIQAKKKEADPGGLVPGLPAGLLQDGGQRLGQCGATVGDLLFVSRVPAQTPALSPQRFKTLGFSPPGTRTPLRAPPGVTGCTVRPVLFLVCLVNSQTCGRSELTRDRSNFGDAQSVSQSLTPVDD